MIDRRPIFADRADAGRRLAAVLGGSYDLEHPVVLALPRGGVPVAFEVATALDAPLDLVFVRKIGAPAHPELGIGALVDGAEPQVVMNPDAQAMVAPPPGYVDQQVRLELKEIERRRKAYLGGRKPTSVRDRTVLLVDDGVATGGTIRAALQGLARSGARRRVIALPVGPADVVETLQREADEVVCLATPQPFIAVGLWYRDFTQTTDDEVVDLLARAGRREIREARHDDARSGPAAGPR